MVTLWYTARVNYGILYGIYKGDAQLWPLSCKTAGARALVMGPPGAPRGGPPRVGAWRPPQCPTFRYPDFKFASNMFSVSEYVLQMLSRIFQSQHFLSPKFSVSYISILRIPLGPSIFPPIFKFQSLNQHPRFPINILNHPHLSPIPKIVL